MELTAYLDAAKFHQKIDSDADLARKLGINKSMLTYYRSGRSWPDDETMIKLAQLCGPVISPHAALVDLNIWRAKDRQVKGFYTAMRDAIRNLPGTLTRCLRGVLESLVFVGG